MTAGRETQETGRHRIQVRGDGVTAVRERVERVLGVKTTARPEGMLGEGGVWAVYFDAPANVNLDFLRPDVLPPLAVSSPEANQ